MNGISVFIWAIYNSSDIGKVVIWLLIIILAGGFIYHTCGWTGIVVVILVLLSPFIYSCIPTKEERKQKKKRKKRALENKDVLQNHPNGIVMNWSLFDDSLPRVYELVCENDNDYSASLNNDIFAISFSLLPDRTGINVIIENKCDRGLRVIWKGVQINKKKARICRTDGMLYKNNDIIYPKKKVQKVIFRSDDWSVLPSYIKNDYYRNNRVFTIRMKIISPDTIKENYTYQLRVVDLNAQSLDEYDTAKIEAEQKLFLNERRELTEEIFYQKLEKVLEKHTGVHGDTRYYPNKKLYRLYWLDGFMNVSEKNVADDMKFKVDFAMSDNYMGMVVTITNTSEDLIYIDWPSFRINKSWVLINGEPYYNYKLAHILSSDKIEPGTTETKILRPMNLFPDGELDAMFDLSHINKEEMIYTVTFSVKTDRKRRYSYDVHTKKKLIY